MTDKIKIPLFIALGVAAGVLLTLGLMSLTTDEDSTQQENHHKEMPLSPTSSQPFIPDEIIFCEERVPLENFDVYEALDYELVVNMYRHSATITYLKKAKRYFPEIEKVLKENNIPDDLKYLCVAESGLSNVVSPAGATGFWQFMKSAANEYGLRIDTNIDERYNHHKSVVAACKYFKDAYKKFKSWTLVAASYNMGMGGVSKSIESQKVDNYWDLLLNQETARYVYRIIALKLVMENPSTYGFNLDEKDLY
ncbi:MAG: lytic transglycosylase domain-containing protein, partial [Bacteroidales bacterium]|nr:lytic transglycosylase domain-containing protein [Bacteroidales bacterium]